MAEELREKLTDYVEDAHAMEQSVLRSLDAMISTTEDHEIRQMLEHHKEETERHERLLRDETFTRELPADHGPRIRYVCEYLHPPSVIVFSWCQLSMAV